MGWRKSVRPISAIPGSGRWMRRETASLDCTDDSPVQAALKIRPPVPALSRPGHLYLRYWRMQDGAVPWTAQDAVQCRLAQAGHPIELGAGMRYYPFGEVRDLPNDGLAKISATDFGYTGQRANSYINLMDYRSRWYDPALGRWSQPDSIIPGGNPQSINRYSYILNNPVNGIDPTGHKPCDEEYGCSGQLAAQVTPLTTNSLEESLHNPSMDESGSPDLPINPTDRHQTNNDTPSETPPPPYQMTETDKIGMALTTAMVEITIILPIEYALMGATIESSAACVSGVALFCVADIPLAAADIVVADFAVSLTVYTAESISNGQREKFKWIIIPAIFNIKQ